VGQFAVQFAKARGAVVIATAREDNRELLLDLGADEVIGARSPGARPPRRQGGPRGLRGLNDRRHAG
jgi:NADPH:quinone reductase-like Zn-dependent oxidoreductase